MRKCLSAFCFFITFIVLSSLSVLAAEDADDIVIDTSKVSTGIVSVQYEKNLTKTVKVQIVKADNKYSYTIQNSNVTNLPLQMGTGTYKISILENVSGTTYKVLKAETFEVPVIDDKLVYTNSIQLASYTDSQIAVPELKALVAAAGSDKEKVDMIYNYVITNLTYDFDKLNNLPSDYVPVNDNTYANKKGICYDFSSLFASTLRSMNIPTRLLMGYCTEVKEYHAWNQLLLDGQWVTMDTTYDSQARGYKMNYSQIKDSSQFTIVKQY